VSYKLYRLFCDLLPYEISWAQLQYLLSYLHQVKNILWGCHIVNFCIILNDVNEDYKFWKGLLMWCIFSHNLKDLNHCYDHTFQQQQQQQKREREYSNSFVAHVCGLINSCVRDPYCLHFQGKVTTHWPLQIIMLQVHGLVKTALLDLSSDDQWKVRQQNRLFWVWEGWTGSVV